MSAKSIRTEKIFLKSKYYPVRNESSNLYRIDDFEHQFNVDSTIISCWIINNLLIKNKIDCMFLKIMYTKIICINYTKYIIRKNKRKLKIVLFEYSKKSIRTDKKFSF